MLDIKLTKVQALALRDMLIELQELNIFDDAHGDDVANKIIELVDETFEDDEV